MDDMVPVLDSVEYPKHDYVLMLITKQLKLGDSNTPKNNDILSFLLFEYDPLNVEFLLVCTNPGMQGKGLATELLKHAHSFVFKNLTGI